MVIMTVAFTPRVYGCFDPNFFYKPYPTPSVGETVTFNASTSTCDWNSTTQEYVPIVSYEWDFGDGTDGTGVIETHTYTEQGTYNVTLTITDEKGTNGTLSIEIEVGSNVDGGTDGFPWWIAVVVVAAGVGVALPVYFTKVRKPTK
jgi:PKD repeat protein